MARGKIPQTSVPDAPKHAQPSPDEKIDVEDLLDEAIEESMPASDPPAVTVPGSLAAKKPARPKDILRVAIILGSTRPERKGEAVAKWTHSVASRRGDALFEMLDLREINLPLLDEPLPPSMGQYSRPHTRSWAARIDAFDAYVFVTAEYNHGIPGALKNAIDFLYREWNDKAAGFVAYGSAGGVRAVEQLRLVMGELQVADVRTQVMLSLFTDFKAGAFTPAAHHEKDLATMLDQLVAWARALRELRRERTTQQARAA